MVHLIGLTSVFAALWLLLSGHTEPYLLALGALSIGLTVFVLRALKIADAEAMPLHLLGRGLRYWPWLIREILKANWDVAKIIANPRLPISPTMARVTASQKTELGRAIYANSITLTPGTISVELDGDQITIHALTTGGADGTEEGTMDRKVTWLETAP
ncbi:Na+/H+ antiporter subunit E [Insolitispirillum peregrinum]|uniref:Multisubunit sodium/proton antiporter, MrpE subunit n=1 Tax=Insolitispirillum peregrinum TaxID=80876 RepID=A0A1N7NH66_9PROT|nr:Na+/H+ antiporter subunit E [Insolitispirillum peregrinum]SIS97598.1 multisubunit sodium/proton antiporter, MrpE subunit [Insolitispirillum peregrinum]